MKNSYWMRMTTSRMVLFVLWMGTGSQVSMLHGFTVPFHNVHHPLYTATTTTTTTLYGRAWDALKTHPQFDKENSDDNNNEDEDDDDEKEIPVEWYLLNCIAGVELALLKQCREVSSDLSQVERFAVPTQRQVRSHGPRTVVEDVVLYPGYVFAKLRLDEHIYETLSSLVNCRSWMGTQRRAKGGLKRLPSVPCPLSDEEIQAFQGLEEELAQEKEEKTVEDMMAVYLGLEVGDMVKILDGKHAGEDGIVKRLKNGRTSVRLYTYGSQFDEWIEPSQLRPLTELELLRGLGGRDTPLRQGEFDESLGIHNNDENEERRPEFSKRNQRRALLSNVKGQRQPRDRKEDRVARGDTSSSRGISERDQLQQEEQQWQRYQRTQQDSTVQKQVEQRQRQRRQEQDHDSAAAYDVDSQWGRGDTNKPLSSPTETSKITNDSNNNNNNNNKKDDDDFFNNLLSELDLTLEGGDQPQDQQPATTAASNKDNSDDFFSSLMSELSSSSPDDSDPTTNTATKSNDEDDFFASLEREMAQVDDDDKSQVSVNDNSNTPPTTITKSNDEDDFFAGLEREMAQLDDDKKKSKLSSNDDSNRSPAKTKDEDDFFASLKREMAQMDDDHNNKAESNDKSNRNSPTKTNENDDFFASLERETAPTNDDDGKWRVSVDNSNPSSATKTNNEEDDFFASLEREMAQLDNDEDDSSVSPSSVKPKDDEDGFFAMLEQDSKSPVATKTKTTTMDLRKFTVPVLKSMLKERGLKVSGKKADLIERLQQE